MRIDMIIKIGISRKNDNSAFCRTKKKRIVNKNAYRAVVLIFLFMNSNGVTGR
jgi:hypothetical protein